MKTLFLDFDGVLHDKYAAEDHGISFDSIKGDPYCFAFAPHLASALDGSDVDIVVHSGWRQNGQFTDDQLRAFIGPLGSRFKGTTPQKMKRHESILKYIDDHKISDYVILDDAADEFPADVQGLIVCDSRLGVSDENVRAQLKYWLLDS